MQALVGQLDISSGANLWDIGCDHAQVGLAAFESELCHQLFLVDPVLAVSSEFQIPGPLERKIIRVKAYAQDLAYGPGPADQVIMAGLGTRTMIEVMRHWQKLGIDLKSLKFVLSPQSELEKMRRFLAVMNLGIQAEVLVQERGNFFEIWKTGGDHRPAPFGDYLWQSPGPIHLQYLEKLFRWAKSKKQDIDSGREDLRRLEEIQVQIVSRS